MVFAAYVIYSMLFTYILLFYLFERRRSVAMKEIGAVTFASETFLTGSVKGGKADQLKTTSASFDSFLNVNASSSKTVQPKTDAGQFKANVSETQSDTQTKTDAVQSVNDGVEQDAAVQPENTEDAVTKTSDANGTEQVEDIKVTEDVTDEEITGINEIVALINQTIRDIVKNITGMDDEMLSNAMSALGLVETDLLDTSNLAKLVLMVNGSSDMTDLLANEDMMLQFNDILDALKDIDWEALTGMSKEEFMPILENMAADESVVTDGNMAGVSQGTDVNTDAGQPQNSVPVTVEYVDEESTVNVRQAVDTDVVQAAVKETTGTDIKDVQTDKPLENVVVSDKEGQVVDTKNLTEQSSNFEQESTDSQTDGQVAQSTQTDVRTPVHNEVLNGTESFLQNLSQAVADVTGETIPQQTNMQQMIDIVNQVVEQIKVTLGKETTSMQLQLNPESLGKVLISVSSNHGVMTANFTVQTEEAKEALQSQMYSLREALESRSLKVDAVEVEVSDFAFSQSNQADAQNQKEFEKGNGRRFRFNFDDSSEDADTVGSVQNQERSARPNLGSSIDFTA